MKRLFLIVLFGGLLMYFLGMMAGRYLFPVKVPISQRKEACEAKGGKYNYIYNEIGKGYYYEKCKILSKEIKDF